MSRLFLPLFCLIGILTSSSVEAQKWELGVFLGGSNYTGDLTHDNTLYLQETGGAAGIMAQYSISPYVAIRSNIMYGRIQGDDENASRSEFTNRNLSFRSDVFEASLVGQVYLTGYDMSQPLRSRSGSAYIFGGIALFNFDPQAQVGENPPPELVARGFEEEDWVSLQELGTEGQGQIQVNNATGEGEVEDLYALTTFSIPLGIGYKQSISRTVSIGFEVGTRITFTDYLDDVSGRYPVITPNNGYQNLRNGVVTAYFADRSTDNESQTEEFRGSPINDDWYHFAGLTITYTIMPDRCFYF